MHKLKEQHLIYCRHRVEGVKSLSDCYLAAFPACKSTKAASANAHRIEKWPEIQAEINRLRAESEADGTLSRIEKRQFLARVVRAKMSNLDKIIENRELENHDVDDLLVEVTNHYDGKGNLKRKTFKLPSKTQCIEIDNKMMGHDEPEKHEHNHKHEGEIGGVMIVPAVGASIDEYEKIAIKQQEELTGGINQ